VIKKVFYMVLSAFVASAFSAQAQADQPQLKSGASFSGRPSATAAIIEQAVWEQLNEVKDEQFITLWPLIYSTSEPLSVVDMGLIYSVKVENNNVHVVLTTYHKGFMNVKLIASPVRKKILAMPGIGNVTVECIWPPIWTPDRLSEKARKVLRYEPGDPVEGTLHVRSIIKSSPDAKPDQERNLDRNRLVIPDTVWGVVDTLKDCDVLSWHGYHYFKRFEVEERDGLARQGEPIFLDVSFAGDQINDMAKEIRVIDEEIPEKEIPYQVIEIAQEENIKKCTIVFLSNIPAMDNKRYLLLYGNSRSDLQAPVYLTDLVTQGERYGLDIENSFYKVHLSPTSGHLKTLQFKKGGKTFLNYSDNTIPPQTIFDASNDPGSMIDLIWHGEDYCIHWGPDFSDQFRYRMTMWSEVPNYSVVKGPICTIVKRWGYPITTIYPAFPQTAGTIEVTYTFYSGLPYFTMESRIKVEKEIDIRVVRNDQWTFKGVWTHEISMPDGGEISVYQKQISFEQDPALMGCYNSVNGDGFASLHISFDALGFRGAYANRASTLLGSSGWVRYAFYSQNINSSIPPVGIQPGATIGEYNAYLVYNANEPGGNNQARDWYNLLRKPLKKNIPDYPTSVNEQGEESTVPKSYILSQNYPNPFNSSTEVSFTLPVRGNVELSIYNLAGQKVATLVQGTRGAGAYTVHWDGRDDSGKELASGVFLYQMRAGNQVKTRKLLLLR
jgi:metal-sulfur cluster biosynthetic enzyme